MPYAPVSSHKLALSENEDSAACHNSDRRFRPHFEPWLRQQEFAENRMLLSGAAEFLFCRFQQFRKFGRFVGDRSISELLYQVASSQQSAEFCLGDLGGRAERARPAEFCLGLGDLVGGLSEPALRIKKCG